MRVFHVSTSEVKQLNRQSRDFNTAYRGDFLNRVAFPLGGLGAGMFCLEGRGTLSHFSLWHGPDVFNEPVVFSALCLRQPTQVARVLEGPVPAWRVYGSPGSANGARGKTYGLPRCQDSIFSARFPFGTVELSDPQLPLGMHIVGWSPFIPGDADNSAMPVAALEYVFTNRSNAPVEAVFSFHAANFMANRREGNAVCATKQGFVLTQAGLADSPWQEGAFLISTDAANAQVDCAWFRGSWFDAISLVWKSISEGRMISNPPVTDGRPSPGGSIYVPIALSPGETTTITLRFAWYVPFTNLRTNCSNGQTTDSYQPWYSGRYRNVEEVAQYWCEHYGQLRHKTATFTDCFYDTTLPPEIVEAVAANLCILKSPTVLRQRDGRLWAWEGCTDVAGCCPGSCTHVWNYAQALPHLFPDLERTLRDSEFGEAQCESGHQSIRVLLPIRVTPQHFHAAADGQLGGIIKLYRDWRVNGDTAWLKSLWPKARASLDYCIVTWDPTYSGVLAEPHHNTYDIEFWGPDGMCTSFYLGALTAAIAIGEAMGDSMDFYKDLLAKGRAYMENQLFNGEYFIQQVQWRNLRAGSPLDSYDGCACSPEEKELMNAEGPKYQYGTGCLSDGVIGAWLAALSGLPPSLDPALVRSHLHSVYRYNLKHDLSQHANPQRPSYALGHEAGLLLCTWPHGDRPSLPFVYSDEVWTGIEYQVASHLMLEGMVDEGLEIVRVCRTRYDGCVRNPFDEYECGHWYARAMASYSLIQAYTGVRYDAPTGILHMALAGDFRCFLSTATGFGTVGVQDGQPFVSVAYGTIPIKNINYLPR